MSGGASIARKSAPALRRPAEIRQLQPKAPLQSPRDFFPEVVSKHGNEKRKIYRPEDFALHERTGTLRKSGRIQLKGGGSYPVLQESDIYAPVAAALVKHGLVLWPSVLSCDRHGGGVDVLLRVVLEDTDSGETREIQGPGSAPIKDTKETTVATGAAMKNCLRRLFLICTEDDEQGKAPRAQQSRQATRSAPVTPDVSPTPPDAPALISEGQRRRLFALCHEHKVEPDSLKNFLFVKHGFASSRDLTKAKYEVVCAWIQGGGK